MPADGFVFPSTTETLGLVLYEGMESGLPIMAADSAATRKVLECGQVGLIFDPSDSESIIMTARDLLFNQQTRVRILTRAREVVSNLDWNSSTQQLIRHYRDLLKSTQDELVTSDQQVNRRHWTKQKI